MKIKKGKQDKQNDKIEQKNKIKKKQTIHIHSFRIQLETINSIFGR